MPQPPSNLSDFRTLQEIIRTLLGPEGCPWDKAQTHESLAPYAIEEAFELAEACTAKDPDNLKEELGDVLLQVLLHSEIASLEGVFDFPDVVQTLSEKMVRRHPHVFSDQALDSPGAVANQWQKIKDQEKKPCGEWAVFQIPAGMNALSRSQKIGKRSRDFDFDWDSTSEVMTKVDEEMRELKEAMNLSDRSAIEAELGDVLFSLAQLARHLDLDAESALRKCNQRFLNRVMEMLKICTETGQDWHSLSADEREALWSRAKSRLSKG